VKFLSIILASILITSLVGLSNFDNAFAQTYNGVITLNPIPSKVDPGETVVFSGKFFTRTGTIIQNAEIYIKDVVPLGPDKIITSAVTDHNGEFRVSWTAVEKSIVVPIPYNFYASYEIRENNIEIKSSVYSLTVDSWSIPSYGLSGGSKSVTTIELDKIPSSVHVGEYVTFTGKVLENGKPLPYALVQIKKKDPLDAIPIENLVDARTNSDGKFNIRWKATADYLFKDLNVYAVLTYVDGSYRTPSQTLTVNVTYSPT